MSTFLSRVIIFVGDVQKCAAFYRDMFDLDPLPSEYPPEEWAELDAGGCRLAFHKAYGPEGPMDQPTGSPMNPHKIVFYAEDVAAMRGELIRRGAGMEGMKTQSWNARIRKLDRWRSVDQDHVELLPAFGKNLLQMRRMQKRSG